MEIEEGVLRRGRIYYSFKIIPSFKNVAKTSLPASMLSYIFDSLRLGLSSSANILQRADVALPVVFLLFLLCF